MLRSLSRLSGTSIAPFTVFHSTGMLMARPMALYEGAPTEEGATPITREGYVSMTVIPRLPAAEGESGVFEKEKKVSVKLRSKQIGQLIAWKFGRTPLSLTCYAKSMPVTMELRPNEAGLETELILTPKQDSSVEPVSITLSSGEIKSFQILLEAALPQLYGWVGPSQLQPKKFASTTSKSPEEFFKQFA